MLANKQGKLNYLESDLAKTCQLQHDLEADVESLKSQEPSEEFQQELETCMAPISVLTTKLAGVKGSFDISSTELYASQIKLSDKDKEMSIYKLPCNLNLLL